MAGIAVLVSSDSMPGSLLVLTNIILDTAPIKGIREFIILVFDTR
jgi:hypothetical protein